ncbi:MAG: hypothetical protein ACFFCS_29290, partial [Candidatus Hodarchaeota archaeon]
MQDNDAGEITISYEELNVKMQDNWQKVLLPDVSPEFEDDINPIIPPTSGIRIELLEKRGDEYYCPVSRYSLFLRIFKSISMILSEKMDHPAKILVTSDERPTSDKLVKDCIRILACDGHEIHVQDEKEGVLAFPDFKHSGVSTPYSSASIAVFPELDAVICITASHNSLVWNGVKFYYQQPIPIAGNMMKEISERALNTNVVLLENEKDIVLNGRNYEAKINDYVKDLIQKIIPIKGIQDKPIILWPYMGDGKGIHDILNHFNFKIVKISKRMEPPDPTINFPLAEVKGHMEANRSDLAILLDADRDRIVFLVKVNDEYVKMNPNELYTSMHNILVNHFNKQLLNVRTVPSDPRSDGASSFTIETGVGYKHLGIVQYLACGLPVEQSQFESALIYGKTKGTKVKIDSQEKLIAFLNEKLAADPEKSMIMALWEESGGHTANIVTPVVEQGKITKLKSDLPLIGDKFPAVAIILLSELISRDYNLLDAIDMSIIGKRIKISADDRRKKGIMEALDNLVGNTVTIEGTDYRVEDYRDNGKKLRAKTVAITFDDGYSDNYL